MVTLLKREFSAKMSKEAMKVQDAMLKAYKEGLGVDFALVCEGVVKQVHSQLIMARSPYMEAKVNRWSKEKRELVIDDCDVTSFNIIVDYMYGI